MFYERATLTVRMTTSLQSRITVYDLKVRVRIGAVSKRHSRTELPNHGRVDAGMGNFAG